MRGPGGTLGISGWGCATETLEPLAYTRAGSAEFCYPYQRNEHYNFFIIILFSLILFLLIIKESSECYLLLF